MKNKLWIWIIAGVVVLAGVVFFVVRNNKNNEKPIDEPAISDTITNDVDDQAGEDQDQVDVDIDQDSDETDVDKSEPETTTTPQDATSNNSGNSSSTTNKNSSSTSSATNTTKLTGQFALKDGTKFEVLSIEDVDNNGNVSEWVTATFGKYVKEAQIKEAIELIVSNIKAAKPKMVEVTTQFFISKDDVSSTSMFNNAIAYWGPQGVTSDENGNMVIPKDAKYDYVIQMAAEPKPLPDKIAGLSYSKAKDLYTRYMSGQSKIEKDGLAKYPDDVAKRQEYITDTTSTLLVSLCKEYGVSVTIIGDIILAALTYRW